MDRDGTTIFQNVDGECPAGMQACDTHCTPNLTHRSRWEGGGAQGSPDQRKTKFHYTPISTENAVLHGTRATVVGWSLMMIGPRKWVGNKWHLVIQMSEK